MIHMHFAGLESCRNLLKGADLCLFLLCWMLLAMLSSRICTSSRCAGLLWGHLCCSNWRITLLLVHHVLADTEAGMLGPACRGSRHGLAEAISGGVLRSRQGRQGPAQEGCIAEGSPDGQEGINQCLLHLPLNRRPATVSQGVRCDQDMIGRPD